MERIAATLFGKTRRAVLTALFLDPHREFRLRELSRLTGISAGSIQHELKQLISADLVRRESKNGNIIYRADVACPIFSELAAIVEKTSGIEVLMREALEPFAHRISLAFVYGSIAKGENRTRSDVDVLVVGSISFRDLIGALAPFEEKLGREISPRLYTKKEFQTRLRKRDPFLVAVMNERKIVIMGAVDDTR